MQKNLEDFKKENNITSAIWEQSGCDWNSLLEIANDHDKNNEILSRSAEFFARIIQTFSGVHSVRWRVKETSHLLEKIVRKRAAKEKKYENIDASNYFLIVTDLIGIRALHLFKDEYLAIDSSIRKNWSTLERPVIYIREGDIKPTLEFSRKNHFKVKQHPAGYRSVHYVLGSSPLKKMVIAELQVRTIFEEGWSEIDHKIRYPNFSNDESVKSFLAVFNRLAGSADEMGTFVKGLVLSLKDYAEETAIVQTELIAAQSHRDEAYREMEKIAEELSKTKDISESNKRKIINLQSQIERSKGSANIRAVENVFVMNHNNESGVGFGNENYGTPLAKLLALSKSAKSATSFEQRLETEKKKLEDQLSQRNGSSSSKQKQGEANLEKMLLLLKGKKSK